jgi:hypothetical protein
VFPYSPAAPPSLQPYERYEQGFVHHFFDPTSTADKGRFRVYDARDFQVRSWLEIIFIIQTVWAYTRPSARSLLIHVRLRVMVIELSLYLSVNLRFMYAYIILTMYMCVVCRRRACTARQTPGPWKTASPSYSARPPTRHIAKR